MDYKEMFRDLRETYTEIVRDISAGLDVLSEGYQPAFAGVPYENFTSSNNESNRSGSLDLADVMYMGKEGAKKKSGKGGGTLYQPSKTISIPVNGKNVNISRDRKPKGMSMVQYLAQTTGASIKSVRKAMKNNNRR